MKRTFSILASLALSVTLVAQQPDSQSPTVKTEDSATVEPDKSQSPGESQRTGSFWMEHKMRLSTEILAGLAKADFVEIGKNAARMKGLNRVENFVRRGPAGYKDELKSFNSANQAIIRAAEKEDLEAATRAFNRMTTSCVRCHQRLRSNEAE